MALFTAVLDVLSIVVNRLKKKITKKYRKYNQQCTVYLVIRFSEKNVLYIFRTYYYNIVSFH